MSGMTELALGLVLASAVLHATWNYHAKRVGGGAGFIWLATMIQAVVYAPLAAIVILRDHPTIGLPELIAIVGSAALHVGYFLLLARGYRTGDLSLVYPLARGTGPMLSTAAAIVLLGERPSPLSLGGALLIGVGVFVLTGDPRKFRQSGAGTAVVYALLTGMVIASYTLWDKHAVATLLIPPLLYDWANGVGRAVLLAPYALNHRQEVARHWREHRKAAVMVGLLSPLSYILVLTALTFSPVSTIAPAREISILIGALLGAKLLSEGDTLRRLAAAAVMMTGVVFLALG
jgi:drug/metabolite transporter (DMT)-like permease